MSWKPLWFPPTKTPTRAVKAARVLLLLRLAVGVGLLFSGFWFWHWLLFDVAEIHPDATDIEWTAPIIMSVLLQGSDLVLGILFILGFKRLFAYITYLALYAISLVASIAIRISLVARFDPVIENSHFDIFTNASGQFASILLSISAVVALLALRDLDRISLDARVGQRANDQGRDTPRPGAGSQ